MITRELESFGDGASATRLPEGVFELQCKRALSKSKLPGLDYALNPYVGCAHGCIYCYAPFLLNRPRETWRGPVGARITMPHLLRSEVSGLTGTIGIGTVTDPYQPAEASLMLTRKCLEIVRGKGVRVSIHTKSQLVLRDLDILKRLHDPEVGVTLTTIDDDLARIFEPGAPRPADRLNALEGLVHAGINTYVLIGPIIPSVTDSGVDKFAAAISRTGVKRAMLDRLRLRPGMVEHLRRAEGMRTPAGIRFLECVSDQGYCRSAERQLAKALRERGIAVESAF
ncbi:MAG: radical SAM protein [Methanomassiliicoccales archaeon]|nr:radical SAM protein [Methanomassiliicoccales archaeon]